MKTKPRMAREGWSCRKILGTRRQKSCVLQVVYGGSRAFLGGRTGEKKKKT